MKTKKIKNIFNKRLKDSINKSTKSILKSIPMIISITLLISLINNLIPKSFYYKIFTNNLLIDSIIGNIIGSISIGNPITGYIIAGEMIKLDINLIPITAFLVSWTTVGIIKIPIESKYLGKKFSLYRNLFSFILSIFIAIITYLILGVIK